MARHGINFQAVAEAAHQLAQNGKQPTVEQIRLILGTGSSTTIANHLRQWRSLQDFTRDLSGKEQIPRELLDAVQHLWEKTLVNVHQTLAINKCDSTHSELQKQCDKYKQNNKRWQTLFEQWQNEKIRLDQELESLKEQNRMLLRDNNRLKKQLLEEQTEAL